MNGNTFLLKVSGDTLITDHNAHGELVGYLRSELFETMICAEDHYREWDNLTDFQGVGARSLVRQWFHAGITPLDRAGFRERLRWMLSTGPSPYGKHYPAAKAAQIIDELLAELLGPPTLVWSFGAVEPDFLRSTGYFEGEQRSGYFDGGSSDTATMIYRGHTCYLLLTSGCP